MKTIIIALMLLFSFQFSSKASNFIFTPIKHSKINSGELLSVPTWTVITKNNGGLFGYKSFIYNDNGVNATLSCANPGSKKCTSSARLDGSKGITDSDLIEIDNLVYPLIKESNTDGTVIYKEQYFIIYNYKEQANKLSYEIYTKEEAKLLGYEF